MAQATLTIVGSYFGGPIGGAIGSAIGAMIDNQLFPAKAQGPRLSDLSVSSSAYGEAIPRFWGSRNRAAGKLIWTTGLIETETDSRQGGKGGPATDVTEYQYSMSGAWLIGEGEIAGIDRIMMNGKTVYDANATPPVTDWGLWSDIQIYLGDFTQMPDPTIEAYEGAGNVPAYRGSAYIVITDLQLQDFGNSPPNFEVFVRARDNDTVSRVVLDLCEGAGIDPNTISTSSLSALPLDGLAIGTDVTGIGVFEQLGLVYNFDTAEEDGTLRFVSRLAAPLGYISYEDLAGHEGNDDRPEAIRWSRRPETKLPREASLVYPDIDRDNQAGTQSTRRATGSSQNNLKSEVAIAMDADRARPVADRMMWEAVNSSQTGECATDDRFLHVSVGRKYFFETPAGVESLRVVRKTRGADGIIRLSLQRIIDGVYIPSSDPVPSTVPDNEVALPGETTLALLDAPLLLDSQDDTGFYWVVAGQEQGWRGCFVERSSDLGNTYQVMGSTGRSAAIGELETAMPSASAATWDRGSTLRVRLVDASDSLESKTELEVLNGANAAWIGDWDGKDGEIIQFADVTQISDDLWELSTFLRGRKGTEHAIGTSAIGHAFVPLNVGTLQRDDFGAGDWYKERLYRGVSLLTDADDADVVAFSNGGESKAPLSPVLATGTRDGSGDVFIEWVRRSRLQQAGLGNGPLPLGEESELYDLEIYDGPTLVRTEQVTSPEFDYTAGMQTADGLTPGDPVSIVIYQISGVRGRGRPGTFTV